MPSRWCRKVSYAIQRGEGLRLKASVCRGQVDDNGVCQRCGGVSGRRDKAPVERLR